MILEEVYVCRIGADVMFVGTRDQCIEHQESRPFPTHCWDVSLLQDVMDDAYERGYDSGYEAGHMDCQSYGV